jgi:hypothetical protein
MSRSFGLILLVVSLAIGGVFMAMSSKSTGPTSKSATQAEAQAQAEGASLNFGQATLALQAYQGENGTFVGASLPPSYGVTVVRADATSYCLQTGVGAAMQHELGPGGAPLPGACP